MTKTLTEQWREGRLKGWHYLTDYNGKEVFRYLTGVKPDADFIKCFEDVLAPVPSYDEYKQLVSKTEQLEKKLEIATKALKEYANKDKWHYCSEDIEYFYTTKDGWYDAEQALKEMEGVK